MTQIIDKASKERVEFMIDKALIGNAYGKQHEHVNKVKSMEGVVDVYIKDNGLVTILADNGTALAKARDEMEIVEKVLKLKIHKNLVKKSGNPRCVAQFCSLMLQTNSRPRVVCRCTS